MEFIEFNLSKNIFTAIEEANFVESSPIRELTIPLALEDKDVTRQAQTGIGKTVVLSLPTLDKIDTNCNLVQALVIAPTCELAAQGQEELFRFGHEKGVKVRSVYGGSSIEKQIKALRSRARIVVGTPGRLLDLIKHKALKLSHVETLILDEADEMLNMGFLEDAEAIISRIPEIRQALLLSTTMSEAIKYIGVKLMQNPEHVKVAAKELTTDLVDQCYIRVKEQDRFDAMIHLMDVNQPGSSIVFGRTKRRADGLTRELKLRGYRAESIHGDFDRGKRLHALRDLKNDNVDILVATDVTARGLDISGVAHVHNHDIPQDPESYVHRIRHTGRAEKHGQSIIFIAPNKMGYLSIIEELTEKRMRGLELVTADEAFKVKRKVAPKRIEHDFTDEVIRVDFDKFKGDAVRLVVGLTPEKPMSYISNLTVKDPGTLSKVEIARGKPLPSKPSGGGFNNHKGGRGNGRGRDNRRGGRPDRERDGRDDNGYRDFRRTSSKNKHDFQNEDNKRSCHISSEKKIGFVIHNKGEE